VQMQRSRPCLLAPITADAVQRIERHNAGGAPPRIRWEGSTNSPPWLSHTFKVLKIGKTNDIISRRLRIVPQCCVPPRYSEKYE